MAWWLKRWISKSGITCSKPPSGSKFDSAFYPSEVDQMSNTNFLGLIGIKVNSHLVVAP